MTLSRHAKIRMQQRGVKQNALNALLESGKWLPTGGNAYRVVLTKQKKSSFLIGDLNTKEKAARIFAIVARDSNTVITVGIRTKRIRSK
jgi:hypothetical protein